MEQKLPSDWEVRALRSWHLAILRFALTREHADWLNVLAAAHETDRLGRPDHHGVRFEFFRRTSTELCQAILHREQASREPMLRRYLARIDNPKLKRALTLAMDLEPEERAAKRPKPYSALWRAQPTRQRA